MKRRIPAWQTNCRERSITIIGAPGAIGGAIGAFITRAGYDVTLVDVVPEHVAKMNADGLRIEGIRGDKPTRSMPFMPDLTGPLDVSCCSVSGTFHRRSDEAIWSHAGR
ncbi:MAG: 2-dehydropantoate 2-reductase N-terminal domain-containing protein [Thermomicrobiales bacterium]